MKNLIFIKFNQKLDEHRIYKIIYDNITMISKHLEYLIIMPPKQSKRGVKIKECESPKPKQKPTKKMKNSFTDKTKPISKYLLKKKFMST